jgi:TPR repeat protein
MKDYDSGHIDRRAGQDDAGTFVELGLSCTVGRSVPVDFVAAHKWFNLAAMLGNAEATRLRHEIAAQMSCAEITAAQRAARAWKTKH